MELKELVGTRWQHRADPDLEVVVKDQFIVGSDIEPWVDCRDTINSCHMMRAVDLARDYQRIS